MFSIYAKVITPDSSPILGPTQSPNQTMDPLDSLSKQQPLIDKQSGIGIGLLCKCCSRTRSRGNSTTISEYDTAQLSHSIANDININNIDVNNIDIQSHAHIDVLEKCKHETHFTHYNYRVITPRQMPPF